MSRPSFPKLEDVVARSDLERVTLFFTRLEAQGARREVEARAELAGLLAPLIKFRFLKRGVGFLGAVVTLDRAGFHHLGKPFRFISTTKATEEIAWREMVALAVKRGYEVTSYASTYLRLKNHEGEHVMYIRVSRNPPSTHTVAQLLKKHRASLKRDRGKLILVVHDPAPYARQLKYQRQLEVWGIDQ